MDMLEGPLFGPGHVLEEIRDFLTDERDDILATGCRLDRVTLEPRRETLDPDCKPMVDRIEGLIADIDLLLAMPVPAHG